MIVLEKRTNMYIMLTDDGVIVFDINELIMGRDDTVIGHFSHRDKVIVAQPIVRYSALAQQIMHFLLQG